MPKNSDKRPYPADLLYKNLFKERTHLESCGLISEGISASFNNANRLLSDARYLTDAGRHSSAKFILTTAREEIAKSFLLLDMCRLDWNKRESVLRRLCKAFYNHIAKHAYMKVLDSRNIRSMADAKRLWEIEVNRFWPAPPESGAPDMPHETSFTREMPLYVDYGDYDRSWLVPTDCDDEAFWSSAGKTRFAQIENRIEKWKLAESIGVVSAEVLAILNSVFKDHCVVERTPLETVGCLYQEVAKRVDRQTGITVGSFMESPVIQWPLYNFV